MLLSRHSWSAVVFVVDARNVDTSLLARNVANRSHMILQRAFNLSSGTLYPCLRSLVQVGLGVDLTSESSLPIRKSASAPSRLQQLDAQRHSFNTSITTCSTEFEEGRIADLETNTDPVVQHRKMGAACLTMNRSASGNALNEEVLYINLNLSNA